MCSSLLSRTVDATRLRKEEACNRFVHRFGARRGSRGWCGEARNSRLRYRSITRHTDELGAWRKYTKATKLSLVAKERFDPIGTMLNEEISQSRAEVWHIVDHIASEEPPALRSPVTISLAGSSAKHVNLKGLFRT